MTFNLDQFGNGQDDDQYPEVDCWNVVQKALEELYEAWVKDSAEVDKLFEDLMQTYDNWLN